MIFVTIGATAPFDRLLQALEPLTGEELVVQCGASPGPKHATCVEYLPFDELGEHIRRARVVISHAGVGTIMRTLAAGKRPLVVPRRAQFGEAVDDHQVELARRLDDLGLVTLVEDPATLVDHARSADRAVSIDRTATPELVAELRDFIVAETSRGSHAGRKARFQAGDQSAHS